MELIVFGKLAKIIREKNLIEEKGACGLFTPATGEIAIDSRYKGREFNQILLHEFFHAVLDRIGFQQSGLSYELEQLLVENLSTAVIENFNIKIRRPPQPKAKEANTQEKKPQE